MNNQSKHLSQVLHEAEVNLNGTLIQLDYLQELMDRINLTQKQRDSIAGQIHRLKVNNSSVRDSLTIIPNVGHTD
ncbi:hypothetical protein ABN16_01140 [Levilactobacillus koreensis]|uniref:Uncharacterized protein n=1 Tax=Levilactobacillus koreensis TaxID=637971 RepID=A0AAC8ZFZ3_9LACO|nr:hypothetical protein ABN16_01140 [Levilactobacillus koreensis]